MNTREEIRQLWCESFDDSKEFVDMFFSRVYRDDDALTLTEAGELVSAMLLQRYKLHFHGVEAPMAYVCGAATRHSQRGKGHMSTLLQQALHEAYRRGDTFCSLIPAEAWLYSYYSRFGFAPVFMAESKHYASGHDFACDGDFCQVDDLSDARVYEAFSRLERLAACRVLHSQNDFHNILEDIHIDGGAVAVVADRRQGGRIVSMAFGVSAGDAVSVKDVLGESSEACLAALDKLHESFPGLPLNTFDIPVGVTTASCSLEPRGMMRLVNVEACIAAVAAANQGWSSAIRVDDPIIADNCHTYVVSQGRVSINDSSVASALDVDVAKLAEMLFLPPNTGEAMCFPAVRPQMTLMLD